MTDVSKTTFESTQTELRGLVDLPILNTEIAQRPSRLIEADELVALIEREDVLIVDVREPEQCVDGHIPGAVLLSYAELVQQRGLATGSLPDAQRLSWTLSAIGLHQDRYVIAYDDDTGIRAARLLWTLDVVGHRKHSLLHGGFAAWDDRELPVVAAPRRPQHHAYNAIIGDDSWVDYDYVTSIIGDPDVVLLDTRSPQEYRGETVRAARGGHIPGAVNFDWTLAIDLINNGRLRSDSELIASFNELGVTMDKEIIPYCQTHHRSSHTYLALKHLGFSNVRAYAGSWSEWGNNQNAPIEC